MESRSFTCEDRHRLMARANEVDDELNEAVADYAPIVEQVF